jgi:hypothetical protein
MELQWDAQLSKGVRNNLLFQLIVVEIGKHSKDLMILEMINKRLNNTSDVGLT